VILRGLRQYGFRNLATAELAFAPGVTAIVGPNAAGKSNLLDACYLAASGDLPNGRIADALRWGLEEGFVAAEIEHDDGTAQVHVGLAPGRKLLRLDGQSVRRAELARVTAAVRITPEDAELVHGGPSGRRAWMDDLLSRLSPRHAALTREYAKLLEQRNAALRGGADPGLLAAFGAPLARIGDELVELRARLVRRAGELAGAAYEGVAGGGAALTLRLLRSQGDRPLEAALAASAAEERARGVTVVGPHRDDLAIELDGRSVQTFGSRGEARTAALALRAAELRLLEEKHEEPPLLLLDDFSAELDADRRRYLLALTERGPQALVSGTEPPPHADRVLRVAAGEVREDG
jgi:DNA replication and repair protein RecF